MKIALYKGRQRFISKAICYWTQSPYSHDELVFSDGMCGSSHDLDLGVRLTEINFDEYPGEWDFIEVDGDEDYARRWFEDHSREPYDYIGLLSFIVPVKDNPFRWTCVKAVLTALGYEDAWRFDPSMLPAMFKGIRKSRNRIPCKNLVSKPADPGSGPCGSANCAICSSLDF